MWTKLANSSHLGLTFGQYANILQPGLVGIQGSYFQGARVQVSSLTEQNRHNEAAESERKTRTPFTA